LRIINSILVRNKLQSIYKQLREKYKSSKVDILFIGESPPHPKDPSIFPYFYNEREDRPNRLYRKIAYALSLKEPKAEGLNDFKNRNMWLTDIFDKPVKEVNSEEVEVHLERLFKEIEETHPKKIVTLLPKRKQNQIFLYFIKRQVPPNIKIFSINPWKESNKNLKEFLSKILINQ